MSVANRYLSRSSFPVIGGISPAGAHSTNTYIHHDHFMSPIGAKQVLRTTPAPISRPLSTIDQPHDDILLCASSPPTLAQLHVRLLSPPLPYCFIAILQTIVISIIRVFCFDGVLFSHCSFLCACFCGIVLGCLCRFLIGHVPPEKQKAMRRYLKYSVYVTLAVLQVVGRFGIDFAICFLFGLCLIISVAEPHKD